MALTATKREGAGQKSPAEPARFDPVPGTVVAEKYRVESTLGEGGMGLVVAATHLGLEQRVAIKFLLPEAMRSKVAVERFLREAKVAAKVKSEFVARVHDVGTLDNDVPYIVMEYLEGCDLGDLIDRDGALPIDEACEIALQASEALAEVHAAGIVHRDLKPSNLFVTRRADGSPVAKLLDFGISKLGGGPDDGVDPALTTTAAILGSPSYMSPEQLKSTKEVDGRTDVWSLGAVLFEAVTGKPAFRGETVPQVCAMIASEEPVAPSTLRPDIPAELERTILGCLEKNPDKRTPLVDLARALARVAPERARGSLERIEATLGVSEPRPRLPTAPASGEARRDAMPVLPLATSERARTQSSWGHDRRGRRAGGGAALFLVLVAGGSVAVGVVTGSLRVTGLRGKIEGATSAVTSAASAVSSAVSSVASALPEVPLPSAFPPLPFEDTADSAEPSAEGSEAPAEPSPPAHAGAGPAPAHAATARPHPSARPHHVTGKPWHRRH
ncbi:MAG TPA: serine/threonine-protein kinase [Polyangiaceae bacterium]|nr:serine/threonine-protein kinase [Polyangiaceae bacterium]